MEEFQTKPQGASGKDSCCCFCGCEANNGIIKIILALIAIFIFVLAAFFTSGTFNKIKEWKYIGQGVEAKNTITVSDSGEIYAKPDLAVTSFSVVTNAKTVAEAMSENTKKMNAVIAAVKGKGVEEKDLKTTYFNISPHYDYLDVSKTYPYNEGKRVLAGYDITQSLQVKVRNLEKVGEIIQAAVDNGSNQASDLQFTIDKQDELKKQAREEAISKAKAKAQDLAKELGVKLVRIVGFSDSNYVPYVYSEKLSAVPAGLGGGDVSAQVEPGENKIQASVSITYEIQ